MTKESAVSIINSVCSSNDIDKNERQLSRVRRRSQFLHQFSSVANENAKLSIFITLRRPSRARAYDTIRPTFM